MDRGSGHHVETSSLGGTAGTGRSRSRKKKPKDPNLMSQAEFRREVARLWARSGKMTKSERLAAAKAAFGAWKGRPEWKGKTSVEIAAELRRRASSRVRHD